MSRNVWVTAVAVGVRPNWSRPDPDTPLRDSCGSGPLSGVHSDEVTTEGSFEVVEKPVDPELKEELSSLVLPGVVKHLCGLLLLPKEE